LTGSGSAPAEVFIPRLKKTVDAAALVRLCAMAGEPKTAIADADEAIAALAAEGGGREACLLGPLAELAEKGGAPGTAAHAWLRDLAGKDTDAETAKAAGERWRSLVAARDTHGEPALTAALGEADLLLPLR